MSVKHEYNIENSDQIHNYTKETDAIICSQCAEVIEKMFIENHLQTKETHINCNNSVYEVARVMHIKIFKKIIYEE
jgi:hypothetical protein